ncbi:TIGR00341 family protein [Lacihabitans sp. LS3-19]|nr:TIGR00341 family protein [Lacihabitans sp. LS3-19]
MSDLFNLHKGEEDKATTLEQVKNNISFSGANLWILACAILVASVGLNVNSTAVIIGAMLISPLMGPIVGSGFALGVFDFNLLKKSLKNLLIATLASLIVSALYFYISPFKQAQSELLSRTSPNIYDVLIAFFGGLVGVIAITRVEKGNPIPGVAIATALMPPLCTAGFGLATGNWKFFLGAMFLYSINCVFICIATFAVVKYLKYPAVEYINEKHRKQVQYGITAIILAMLIPSGYFAFSLYNEQKFRESADVFISKEFLDKGKTLIFKNTKFGAKSSTIELAFLNNEFTDNDKKVLSDKLPLYGMNNTNLIIRKNSTENLENFKNNILNEIHKTDIILDEKDKKIADLENLIKKNTFDNKQLLSEINILYPNITEIAVSNQNIATLDSSITSTLMIYKAKKNLNTKETETLSSWLKKRLSCQQLQISQIQ